jgi:hypothetical protein
MNENDCDMAIRFCMLIIACLLVITFYIFALISSINFAKSPLSASLVGHPIPNPSCSFGFGMTWKCTYNPHR